MKHANYEKWSTRKLRRVLKRIEKKGGSKMFMIVLKNGSIGQIFKKNLTKKEAIRQADIMHSDESGVWCEVKRTNTKVTVYTTKKETNEQKAKRINRQENSADETTANYI